MTSSEPRATLEEIRRGVIKAECELDHLFFTRYFFKHRQGIKFIVNWHHYLIADAIQRVIDGKCPNLVINVPPGSSKSEMAVINLIARGLALNPNARFLHITSGDDLALLNSQTARDIILSDEYQALWPLQIADDAKAKKRWNVIVDGKKAGGVYAVSLGGQITGFRAGHMAEGFQGAIIIDDPLKADEAYSACGDQDGQPPAAEHGQVPQGESGHAGHPHHAAAGRERPDRLHQGRQLPRQVGVRHHPGADRRRLRRHAAREAPAAGRRTMHRDDKGRFSYWPYKEPLEDMLALEAGKGADADGNMVSRFVFSSQYQQAPRAIGGNIIKGQWFPRAAAAEDSLPKDLRRHRPEDRRTQRLHRVRVLGLRRGQEDSPARPPARQVGSARAETPGHRLLEQAPRRHRAWAALRELVVEDKSSGTGLIQEIKRTERIPVRGVERNKDKLTRVMDAVSFIDAGFVVLPEEAPFVSDFLVECEAFTADDSHAHDDQIDPMCDAIADMLAAKPKSFFDVT